MNDWIWIVSPALGAIGMIGLLYKKTMLGLIVSIQFMVLGACVLFVFSAAQAMQMDGLAFAVLIVIAGLSQSIGSYALATRLFYLRNKTSVSELRSLKR